MIRLLMVLIASALAVLYGLTFASPHLRGLYFQIPVISMAGLLMGRIVYLIQTYGYSSHGYGFSLGLLGGLGCALFLFSQNMSSVTNAFYDYQAIPGKQRIPAGIFAGAYFVFLMYATVMRWSGDIPYGLGTAVTAAACRVIIGFFSCAAIYKALTFATLKDSFGRCMRFYNISVSIFLALSPIEEYFRFHAVTTNAEIISVTIFYIFYTANIIAMLPLLVRGRSKFVTSL